MIQINAVSAKSSAELTCSVFLEYLLSQAPKALKRINSGDIFNNNIQDGNHSDKEYIGDDPAKFMNMASPLNSLAVSLFVIKIKKFN